MTRNVIIFLLSLLMAGSFAQTPHTFYFQGALKDSDGKPVNDTKFMEFLIYDVETGGEAVWSEGPLSVEIIEGLFSHELGSTIPFHDGLFDTGPLYVTFALASGEMLPRQKLTSVPYALKSYLGDDDWDQTGNYLINLTDSIGIGTSSPKTRFEVNDLMRLTPIGMDEECDLDLEGSIYYDENLKEFCFCNGDYWYQMDGDGYCECVDLDGDGVDNCDTGHPYDTDGLPVDCDDDNPDVYPGNIEYCDGIDNDCDPATTDGIEDPSLLEVCDGEDFDLCEEGQTICFEGTLQCSEVPMDEDFDVCDGADNDCNPETPDGSGDPSVGSPCDGPDSDLCEEGIMECVNGMKVCLDFTGNSLEICDGLDNDCDGQLSPEEIDNDGDGYVEGPIDPGGWFGDPVVIGGGDCDDGDYEINPGALEDCDNGVDDDCDADVDMDDSYCQTCVDNDGDGYGVAPFFGTANGCPFDGDDCDDGNDAINPGASEICDNTIDDDCDTQVDMDDQDCITCVDNDGDGYGAAPFSGTESGCLFDGDDCNDDESTIYPGAPETPYDGVDQDCNGVDASLCYEDNDQDGYGNDGTSVLALDGICDTAEQESTNNQDCVDDDADINPGVTEVPDDGIDQDCDGYDATVCYVDNDMDSYGNDEGTTVVALDGTCSLALQQSSNFLDCDDNNAEIYPDASEVCGNGLDDDCDTELDMDDSDCQYCIDNDGDGFGEEPHAGISNGCPFNDPDCDDGNAAINPMATEIPDDGIDQDCDGYDATICFADYDQDGYGNDAGTTIIAWNGICHPADFGSTNDQDCDDEDPDINPEAEDIPDDGIDQNCNNYDATVCFQDNDQDGFGNISGATVVAPDGICDLAQQESTNDLDCDDGNATIYPGATEVCDNFIDDDCDNQVDINDPDCSVCVDNDMDGYGQAPFSGTASGCPMEGDDCDDEDPGIHPGASEVCFNGFDDDCDDLVDMDDPDCVTCVDNDGDGYGAAPNSGTANGCTFDGDDCNDSNYGINPGASEHCANGFDDDCDTQVDMDDLDCQFCLDNDGDGYGVDPFFGTANGCLFDGHDCDDGNDAKNPGEFEDCMNGVDDDCDGAYDMEDTDCALCIDNDGDGYGTAPYYGTGFGCTFDGDDCDDGNDAINPGATEVCGNAVDDDCDNDVDNDDSDCGGQ